jgi:hypothetical protein
MIIQEVLKGISGISEIDVNRFFATGTLDDRLWRFLKVLYTDKRGLNLRNIVMHGIAEPSDFNQANAALVLQSVMLLTMIREKGGFHGRI